MLLFQFKSLSHIKTGFLIYGLFKKLIELLNPYENLVSVHQVLSGVLFLVNHDSH